MTTETALNVWYSDDTTDGTNWRMAIYLTDVDGVDSSRYFSFTPSKDQLNRYFNLTSDSDWWVYSEHPDYYYVLFGYNN